MKQTTMIIIIVGLLVIFSAAQAVQLYGLNELISDESFGKLATSAPVPLTSSPKGSGAGQGVLPPSVANLPQMVGGC